MQDWLRRALTARGLSAVARRIARYLAAVPSASRGFAFLAVRTIAERLGVARSTVQRATRRLVAAGLVAVTPAGMTWDGRRVEAAPVAGGVTRQTSNRYTLLRRETLPPPRPLERRDEPMKHTASPAHAPPQATPVASDAVCSWKAQPDDAARDDAGGRQRVDAFRAGLVAGPSGEVEAATASPEVRAIGRWLMSRAGGRSMATLALRFGIPAATVAQALRGLGVRARERVVPARDGHHARDRAPLGNPIGWARVVLAKFLQEPGSTEPGGLPSVLARAGGRSSHARGQAIAERAVDETRRRMDAERAERERIRAERARERRTGGG